MTSGEQIMLDDEGEGESEESDPLRVDEADVGGNPSHSTNPSSFSNSTANPGYRFAPQQGSATSRINRPRNHTVKKVHFKLANTTLNVAQASVDYIKTAVRLMEHSGEPEWTENMTKFKQRLANLGDDRALRACHSPSKTARLRLRRRGGRL
jgi:hypothetical protein